MDEFHADRDSKAASMTHGGHLGCSNTLTYVQVLADIKYQ